MTDPRAVRRPRQIVLAAQSFSLLGIASRFAGLPWAVMLSLTALAAVAVVAVVATQPVGTRLVRWLTGVSAVGLAASVFSLWLIRGEEAAIPLAQVGGLFLSLAVTVAMMIVLVGESRPGTTPSTSPASPA